MTPVIRLRATISTKAGRTSFNIVVSSSKTQGCNEAVDGFDPDKRNDDPAQPVNEQIAGQQRPGPDRSEGDTLQR
jgi:hypothetical protein